MGWNFLIPDLKTKKYIYCKMMFFFGVEVIEAG